jgi:hypothetical protein
MDLIGPKENWKPIPFPDNASKQDLVGWIIKTQERRITRQDRVITVLLGAFATTILTLVVFLVTGKLHWIG